MELSDRIQALVSSLDGAVAAIAAASAEVLRDVAVFDEERLWERDGATCMTAWLAGRYGLARGTAREWLRVGRALQGLPRIAEAYGSGLLSWDQLRPVTRFATPETDEEWARRAPGLRPWTLHREAERHERARRREAEDAQRDRFVRVWRDPELPRVYLEGMLPVEQGAALEAALSRRSEQIVLADAPAIPHEARMADALVELVTETKEGGVAPATLVLHAEASVLTGIELPAGPMVAETEDGHRLPPDAVRRLACDGRVEWVLEDHGRPVGLGRQGRTVSGPLLRVLRHRDRGCRFPGCERRRWVQAHHLVHWADGGRTDVDNLVLLCHAHHRLIHEGGWRTSGHPGRDLRFHDPRARPIRDRPPPVRAGPVSAVA